VDAKLRVLVVDDEGPLARLVGEYLTRDGFAVTLAFDDADALRVAARSPRM
jgi:DNA-binding response OmpR family regulator